MILMTPRPLFQTTRLVRAGTVGVIFAVLGSVLLGCSTEHASSLQAFTNSTSAPAFPAINPIACTGQPSAGEVITRQPGGHSSATDAIAAYHYAVITARDPAAAADAVAPGAPMGRPDTIAAAMAGFPAGTTYCLHLTPSTPTMVLMTLDYQPPGQPAAQFREKVTVSGPSGHIRVAGEVDQ